MIKFFDIAVDFSVRTALQLSGKYKQLSGGDWLTATIVVIVAVMMPQALASLLILGVIVVLLTALRKVATLENKPRRPAGTGTKNA